MYKYKTAREMIKHRLRHFHQCGGVQDSPNNGFHQNQTTWTCSTTNQCNLNLEDHFNPESELSPHAVIYWPLKHRFSFLVLLTLFMCSLLKETIQLTFRNTKHSKTHWILFKSFPFNLTYFQPTIDPHPTQKMSATTCSPVIILLSSFSPTNTFALPYKVRCFKSKRTISVSI